MSRNQFIENLRKSKYADLAKNSLRLVILEQHTEIEALESKLEEARYSATDYAMKLGRANEKLAEARDLVFTAYQEGWNDNRTNLDCWETHWTDSDSRYSLEQLKEKG